MPSLLPLKRSFSNWPPADRTNPLDPVPISRTLQEALKPANSNHFEPPSDVASFKACHTVRQTRRLQTFQRSHWTFMAEATEARTANAHKEWNAICRAKSFRPNFRSWCLSTLGSFPADIYSVKPKWLDLAIHECRNYANSYHRKMSILRQQEFVEKLHASCLNHLRSHLWT